MTVGIGTDWIEMPTRCVPIVFVASLLMDTLARYLSTISPEQRRSVHINVVNKLYKAQKHGRDVGIAVCMAQRYRKGASAEAGRPNYASFSFISATIRFPRKAFRA